MVQTYEELGKNIKEKNFAKLYLLYGEENYLKEFYCKMLVDGLKSSYAGMCDVEKFNDPVSADKLINSMETIPMFGGGKIILIRDSKLFAAKKGEASKKSSGKGSKSTSGDDFDFLSDVSDNCHIIFCEDSAAKNTRMYKMAEKSGVCVEFIYLKPDKKEKWVVKQFRLYNKMISISNLKYFIDICEPDLLNLKHEIDKLAEYCDDRNEITRNDIELVVMKAANSKIFALTDAISSRNCSLALNTLNELELMKEPMQRIFFMLCRYFRLLKSIKELSAKGAGSGDYENILKIKSFEASNLKRQSNMFDYKLLKDAVRDCLEYDNKIKNGEIDIRNAVELLIFTYGGRKS